MSTHTPSMLPATAQPEVEPLPASLWHPLLQDPKFVLAALAVLLAVVFFRVTRSSSRGPGRRNGTPTVLLVGPQDGGKTALFAQLAHGTRIATHSSVQPSTTTFRLHEDEADDTSASKPIRVIDIPGHPRLRDHITSHLPEADGVIFVVDVQSLVRNPGVIAEQLPPLLTSLSSRSARNPHAPLPRLLLLASKADLLLRPSSTAICPTLPGPTRQTAVDRLESILTREMDRLKQTRATTGGRIEGIAKVTSARGGWWRFFSGGAAGAGVGGDDQGDEDETLIWGGRGAFRWQDVEGVEVAWGAAAVGAVVADKEKEKEEEKGEGLREVREWLSDL